MAWMTQLILFILTFSTALYRTSGMKRFTTQSPSDEDEFIITGELKMTMCHVIHFFSLHYQLVFIIHNMFPQNSNLCLYSELDASTCGEGDTEQITEEGHFFLHGPEFSQSTWRHSAGGDNSDTSIRNPRGGRGRGASQPLCALNVVAPPTHRVHILVDAIVPCGDLNHNRDSLHLMVPI